MTYDDYDWVTASVIDGFVTLRYRVTGLAKDGANHHDEDVSEWTDDDIKGLASELLNCDPELVAVEWD